MDAPADIQRSRLQARVLGSVQILVNGTVVQERAWSRRTARALLHLLLITPSHRLPREQVLDVLWPAIDPDVADRSLRKAVHALRRVLEPDLRDGRKSAFLEVGGETIALAGDLDLWVDVDEFLREVAAARSAAPASQRQHLQQALSLYRGDLLAEQPYAEWAETQREHLRHQRRRALLTLAESDLGMGTPEASVPLLERLLEEDPTDEGAVRILMRALVAVGQRDQAIRWCHRVIESLRTQLDAEPEGETLQLAAEIEGLVPSPTDPLPEAIKIRLQNAVPAPPNALAGRIRELEDLQDLVLAKEVRLVTITGPGGVGKTRLAQELANQIQDEFPDGVCFVALAALNDPSLVLPAILHALGLTESRQHSALEVVRAALRERALLLVLDNLEHLIDVAPDLASLLDGCAALKILATSREPLRLRVEHLFDTPPLPVPAPGLPTTAVSRSESVVLFRSRAQAVHPGFALTPANAGHVATICSRLDGLPLAIELAAGRIRVLPPEKMLAQLEDRFTLLTEGYRDYPERHRTMRNAITWSYDLLTPVEQAMFRLLSVFVGGCSQEAVKAMRRDIQGVSDAVDADLACLEILVGRSLAQRRDDDAGPRYRLLETIREFGLERLAVSGESETLRSAHTGYFLSLAERAEPELRKPGQEQWFDFLEAEHGNFRAALAWALAGHHPGVALRIGAALWRFWMMRGYLSEGRRWLDRALEDEQAPLPQRAAALSAAGSLAEHQNDYAPAEALHRQALAAWRATGDLKNVGAALDSLGNVAHDQGNYEEAIELHEQALAVCRDVGDQWGAARALNNLGVVAYYQGAYDRAEVFWTECQSAMGAVGDTWAECQVLNNLGALAFQSGNLVQATTLHEQALALRRRMGDKPGMASSFINLGEVALESGDLNRAAEMFEQGTDLMRELEDERQTAIGLLNLGYVRRQQADGFGAAALIHESLSLFHRNGDRYGLAGAMDVAAGLLTALARPELGARVFAAAANLRATIGAARDRSAQAAFDVDMAATRSALDDSSFEAAWNAGATMALDPAVTEAVAALNATAIDNEVVATGKHVGERP
ncbi:MAG TPA: tetratricopeptide repeat protein [Thermomicrobiales bacterium]|nr:tetratricopeptide repeat protein [Thermomicrobiales bacterium]